jgi:hypothetical protein
MKTVLSIITSLVMFTSLSASDRCNVRIISAGKGKGYHIRPEIYKGNSKPASFDIRIYYRNGGNYALGRKVVTLSKAGSYKDYSVLVKDKGIYCVYVYKAGNKIYTKKKGSKIESFVAESEKKLAK